MILLAGVFIGTAQASTDDKKPLSVADKIISLRNGIIHLERKTRSIDQDVKNLEQKVKEISTLLSDSTVPFSCKCYVLNHKKKRKTLVGSMTVLSFSKAGAMRQAEGECRGESNNDPLIAICHYWR